MKKIFPNCVCFLIFLVANVTGYAQINKVESVGMTVRDMDRSVKFYSEALGFKKISDEEFSGSQYENLEGIFGIHIRKAIMQLGDERIELTDYLTSGGRSVPEDMHSNDLSFQHIAIVVSDMDKAFEWLKRFHVEYVSTAPQTLPVTNVAAAGIKAFYFHDPDNHNLELIFFPKGKGQPKWQQSNGKIFLGIDHTAIGISNTGNSLRFYQQVLGLDKKGESWNNGIEQEHLNNIEGASLHITGLRSVAGPGIEFLEYLMPCNGKHYPADTRADDIWYWQTTLITSNVSALYNKLKEEGYQFISKGIVDLLSAKGKEIKAFIVRDPDGHAMLIKGCL